MTIEVSTDLREKLRSQFPALATNTVFLENAGGSQVPVQVADRIRSYLLESYVQLGAGYELSRRSTDLVGQAHAFIRLLMGGELLLRRCSRCWPTAIPRSCSLGRK